MDAVQLYGKVIVEPTAVEHTTGGLRVMTQLVAEACQAEGLTDTIVAVEWAYQWAYQWAYALVFITFRESTTLCPCAL